MNEENGKKDGPQPNYAKIAESEAFKELLAVKRRFIILTTSFFISFALLLPILAFYTDFLTRPAIGAISWAWVFAFAQFVMTWAVSYLYTKKAARFDEIEQRVLLREMERS